MFRTIAALVIGMLCFQTLLLAQTLQPATGKAVDNTSYINLPLSLKFSAIDAFVDKEMKGILYDDTSYTNNNNDNTTARVKKNGVINITGLVDGIQIELPLRIWFSRKIGFYYLNTDFDLTLLLTSKLSLSPKWNIITKSELRSYKITRDPVVKLAGAGIDIKYIVQYSLSQCLPDILKDVDKSFAENDMLKKQAMDAWKTIQVPVVVDTALHSWVKIVPEAFNIEPIKYYRDEIYLNGAMEALVYTGIGKPKEVPLKPFKDVIIKDKLENAFRIQVKIELPYNEIGAIASKFFADTTFTISKKRTVKVDSVILAGNDSIVLANVVMSGSINAKVTLIGTPAYIDSTQEFYLKNFDYTMESDQRLLRIADRLFKEKLRDKFEKSMHYSIKDQMNSAKQTITTFLSDYKLYNKLLITGTLTKFRLNSVASDSNMIYTTFDLNGQAHIKLLSFTD